MSFQKIPQLGIEYALIHFDDRGRERTDDPEGGVFSRALLEKARSEKPSHVFLFSHGWKGDIPSAIDQYNRWIGAMWKLEADRQALGRRLSSAVHRPALAEPAVGRGDRSAPSRSAPPARRSPACCSKRRSSISAAAAMSAHRSK